MGGMVRIWLAVAATVLAVSRAQSISGSNATQAANSAIDLDVSTASGSMVPLAGVLPLTQGADVNLPPPGLSGPALLINQSNTINLNPSTDNFIVLLTCDASAYPGFTSAIDIFQAAEQANVTAVIWYSQEANWCDLQGYSGNYEWVYTMTTLNDTEKMLDSINSLSQDTGPGNNQVYVSIGASISQSQVNTTNPNGNPNNNQGNHLPGPSPSTAVAMIILYSITGIITGLFLVIIVTGAVRAHRHPERYGPSAIIGGRPRQSRARGLARAMLEALPIVKVGERPDPKPTDVELADGSPAREIPVETETQPAEAQTDRETGDAPSGQADGRESNSAEGGIAAASDGATRAAPSDVDYDNHQGCSICTDDFEIGQDQRVLPCDHRFHPACIDPWLLNVSGTCPLCRIDLRPQTSHASETGELDENGNPIARDGTTGEMAPPLAADGDSRRMSVRRSIMLGLMGIGRPDRMTREERVLVLRQYRAQQAATRRREQEAGVTPTAEEERGVRTRLRNAFRVRTRRTGVDELESATTATRNEAEGTEPRSP